MPQTALERGLLISADMFEVTQQKFGDRDPISIDAA
jgi:hypothetical protein